MVQAMRTFALLVLLVLTLSCDLPAGVTEPIEAGASPPAPTASAPTPPPVPVYVPGFAAVRLGLSSSIEDGKEQQAALDKVIGGAGWKVEVWAADGTDPHTKAILQVSYVDPLAGAQLCAWLLQHGWHSGPQPCGPIGLL